MKENILLKPLVMVLLTILVAPSITYASSDRISLFGVSLGEMNYEKRVNPDQVWGIFTYKDVFEINLCSLEKLTCSKYNYQFEKDGFDIFVSFINPRFGGVVVYVKARKLIPKSADRAPYLEFLTNRFGSSYNYTYENNNSEKNYRYRWAIKNGALNTI